MYGTVGLPSMLMDPGSSYLDARDTILSNIDPSTISYVGEFLLVHFAFFVSKPYTTVRSPDSGDSVSPNSQGFRDREWMTIDTVLIRLDTTDMNSAHFPVYLNKTLPTTSVAWGVIGYDAAVCVRRYEPWIVETYNTSIASPSTLRIIGKGNASTPLLPSGKIQGAPNANTRYPNTTGKDAVLTTARYNAVEQMQKDIDKGFYGLSSTLGPVTPSWKLFHLTSTYYSAGTFFV